MFKRWEMLWQTDAAAAASGRMEPGAAAAGPSGFDPGAAPMDVSPMGGDGTDWGDDVKAPGPMMMPPGAGPMFGMDEHLGRCRCWRGCRPCSGTGTVWIWRTWGRQGRGRTAGVPNDWVLMSGSCHVLFVFGGVSGMRL
ncbi:predicted protein [Verticillium alfalfae VaMs.102]|uniref:Predicted protein n=1 Tax=Verticillium alfalfae (strain VaMs.102 / ATCC MYA-4576 / FGSC 10136) TaxID=526221 RepID=C9SKY1_VERA1|nr:predicted protein [Verticillium alfalfae VaMs.102]EEY19349.1 predicted protein [Verticillium alfalfae VaMs.102]